MSSLRALYRLRPSASWLSAVLMAALLCAGAWLIPAPTGTVRAERLLWCASLILPFVLGRSAFLAMLPVMAGSFMWTVPNSRTVLRRGSMTLGVVIALPFGIAQAGLDRLATGAFAFALALIAYNSWTVIAWFGERAPRAGAALYAWLPPAVLTGYIMVIIAPMGRAGFPGDVAVVAAMALALASLAVSARGASRVTPMLDAQRSAQALLRYADPYAASRGSRPLDASSAFETGMAAWTRAALYQTVGDRRGRRIGEWLVETLVIAFVADRMLSIAPVLAIALASLNVWRAVRVRAVPLSEGIFYPASRRTRVRVAFWGRAAATALRVLVLLAFIAAFEAMYNRGTGAPAHLTGLPRDGGLVPAAHATPASLAIALGVFVAIGLMTQSGRAMTIVALGGTRRGRNGGTYTNYLMRLLLPMAGAIAVAHWVSPENIVREGRDVVVLLVGTFVFYWLALRRSSLTMDLA